MTGFGGLTKEPTQHLVAPVTAASGGRHHGVGVIDGLRRVPGGEREASTERAEPLVEAPLVVEPALLGLRLGQVEVACGVVEPAGPQQAVRHVQVTLAADLGSGSELESGPGQLDCFLGRTEVAQHPAAVGVHRPAVTRHRAAALQREVESIEQPQGVGGPADQSVCVCGHLEGVLDPEGLPAAGRLAAQHRFEVRQRLVRPALVDAEDPDPGGQTEIARTLDRRRLSSTRSAAARSPVPRCAKARAIRLLALISGVVAAAAAAVPNRIAVLRS